MLSKVKIKTKLNQLVLFYNLMTDWTKFGKQLKILNILKTYHQSVKMVSND